MYENLCKIAIAPELLMRESLIIFLEIIKDLACL